MISVRPYDAQDRQGVIGTILPIQQVEFKVPITLADQPDLLDIPGFYQNGHGNFWVAVSDKTCSTGEVIGTIALKDFGGARAALRKMFVQGPWRGPQHGIAAKLLDTLLAWALEQGLREIYLGTTAVMPAAHRFYEKNGFALIEAAQLPPDFPRMAVDSRFYLKQL